MHKKMILPVVFASASILALFGYGAVFILVDIPVFLKIIIGAVLLLLGGAMVSVVLERNKEILKEEKDDLGQY